MNRQRRKAVATILKKYRKLKKYTMAQTAAVLGWDETLYTEAEAGRASLSDGQQDDVRRMLKCAAGKSE
jgi:transcriptional regulator with XRE-family HTH domain